MASPSDSDTVSPLKRQAAALTVFGVILAAIICTLYTQHRQREWVLRRAQAKHRLDQAFKLISREVNRVRADASYLASRQAVIQFAGNSETRRDELTSDFIQFVERKELYDQIRLLDLSGLETLRVNYATASGSAVAATDLQNKSDRYYFQEALKLGPQETFVSDFDLNVEHGQIERPLKPVIRFVAPVLGTDDNSTTTGFLVLNYLGTALLEELKDVATPGFTMLLRPDGHYLRSPREQDSWGWLLGHDRTFASQFPEEWRTLESFSECRLTPRGAFAVKLVSLGTKTSVEETSAEDTSTESVLKFRSTNERQHNVDTIAVVSYLPREKVFSASNELLRRLLVFATGVIAVASLFIRAWARATLAKEYQAREIVRSEEKLRELSSRLLRIQEDERRAISREIHDELGQQVTAISLDLKLAERNMETDSAKPHLMRAIQENATLLETLHEFARRVRPAVLDDLGLHDAIESQLSEFQKRTGVAVHARLELDGPDIPDTIADHAYRLVQESLNNVAKHAEATKVTVEIGVAEADQPQLLLSIEDDGCGHESQSPGRGLGLIGMQERADLLGGEFQMESSADQGTSIKIKLPFSNVQTVPS